MEIGEPVGIDVGDGAGAEDRPDGRHDKPALRVVKVVGPARVGACQPATYRVVAYNRRAKPEEKRSVRWEVRFAGESSPIPHPGKPDGDVLVFAKVPDEHAGVEWDGQSIRVYAYLHEPSEKASVETRVECSGICAYVALVRKVERATGFDPETVLNALRRLAGYDTGLWQRLYGLGPAPRLVPTGDLGAGDISRLAGLSSHGVLASGKEVGVVVDAFGLPVAIGHVLTGLSAGQHRNPAADLRPGVGTAVHAGFTLDNLYAATLAGDIGQSAVEIRERPGSPLIGPGSELTDAEAIGDIDGLILGDDGGLAGKTVSQRLHDYYCVTADEPPGLNAAHRFARFGLYVAEHLRVESRRFAVDYLYSRSTTAGAVGSTHTEVERVLGAFEDWLATRADAEQRRR
jgi:hypothetical protein